MTRTLTAVLAVAAALMVALARRTCRLGYLGEDH